MVGIPERLPPQTRGSRKDATTHNQQRAINRTKHHFSHPRQRLLPNSTVIPIIVEKNLVSKIIMYCYRPLSLVVVLLCARRSHGLVSPVIVAANPPSVTDSVQSPLSLNFDDLTESLQKGVGRSRAVWECYRIGIDPLWYYNPDIPEAQLDASVHALILDNKSNNDGNNKVWSREELKGLFRSQRKTQGLGKPALESLKLIGSDGIEESIATISQISRATDGTTKLLVKLLQDSLEVETVIIPWHETGRSTLCISSQVGCAQACRFCATGKMGRLRNLSSSEICAQVFLARKVCRVLELFPVDGVVFMGMGEPADNAVNVVQAAKVLTNQEQFNMAQRKVTISTVGPSPEVFEVLGEAQTMLAWSVHASSDELRKELVPTTKYSMQELRRGYLNALLRRPVKLRTTMLGITLIDGINDSMEDAEHLADFVQDMVDEVPGMKPMVNLIPFNDIGFAKYRKPSVEQVWAYQERLTARGFKCFIRTTRGDDESAACGQLATTKTKTVPR